MKKFLKRIVLMFFIFTSLTYCFCYADEIDIDTNMLLRSKNNGNTIYNNGTTILAPNNTNSDKDLIPTILISGGVVVILVGISIFVLNKLKQKD